MSLVSPAGEPVAAGPRRHRVSAFTYLLVFGPFCCVFALLGRYWIAAAVAGVGMVCAPLTRKRGSRGNEWQLILFSVLGCLLVLFVILPILNLLFTTDPARISAMARERSVQDALLVSVSAAMIATSIALLLGIPLGYVLAREQFAGKAVVEGIVDVPVVIPHTIAGISLLFIFGRTGVVGASLSSNFGTRISDSYWGIVMAMLFVGMPFVINYSRDGFQSVDPRMENVARSLGAGFFGAFFRVTIPLTWRTLLSGAILTWARAISEFVAVAVLAYYPKTINTLLYEWYNFFGYAYAKPLAALLVLIALAIFVSLRAVAQPRRSRQ